MPLPKWAECNFFGWSHYDRLAICFMLVFVFADISGKVRIWDTVNKEHILKNEFQPLGGPIKDIAWSADSQRMCVVGDGRER